MDYVKVVNGKRLPMSEHEIKDLKARQEKRKNKTKKYLYKIRRLQEFPSDGKQMEYIMEWFENNQESLQLTDKLKDLLQQRQAVKDRHPKPE